MDYALNVSLVLSRRAYRYDFGDSFVALIAQLGGGICTKAADGGANWWVKLSKAFLKMMQGILS